MDNIEVKFPGGKRIDAQVGDFTIQTDQSVKYGGEASAPAPFDLFLGSIATCAGIFAWNFCEMRQLSTEGLTLSMECVDDPQKKMIGEIRFNLTLPEGFPEKYHQGIIRAMEQCAVKRHMQQSPEFTVKINN
ncbi:MAG: OsmC family protein [Candidatus Thiodiazotropha sp. (ex Semelilucina semeliformis)]|nr:OsmC family protein [Candidatus Thiodiazotropha sp. (ex Myrtea spinifera)]MCU7808897.1 OsmC family protein [Candidatus Thiodiazotropha sp. (ex Semelilucina semeliformis)]MCU7830559.1 OsmC family protein [Candidatus Thiodiazotropha sp. (ex Myrtea sp. 'scaly one' KF741663)]